MQLSIEEELFIKLAEESAEKRNKHGHSILDCAVGAIIKFIGSKENVKILLLSIICFYVDNILC